MTTKRIPLAAEPDHELAHPTHLVPLVQELVARGNRLATPPEPDDGFIPTRDGWVCQLVDPITDEDWAALSEKFDIPPTISHFGHAIVDDVTWAESMREGRTTSGGSSIGLRGGHGLRRGGPPLARRTGMRRGPQPPGPPR